MFIHAEPLKIKQPKSETSSPVLWLSLPKCRRGFLSLLVYFGAKSTEIAVIWVMDLVSFTVKSPMENSLSPALVLTEFQWNLSESYPGIRHHAHFLEVKRERAKAQEVTESATDAEHPIHMNVLLWHWHLHSSKRDFLNIILSTFECSSLKPDKNDLLLRWDIWLFENP